MLVNLEPSQIRSIATRCLVNTLEEFKDQLTEEQIKAYLFVIREVATHRQYEQVSKEWNLAKANTI